MSHKLSIRPSYGDDYFGTCTCGWESETVVEMTDVLYLYGRHIEVEGV